MVMKIWLRDRTRTAVFLKDASHISAFGGRYTWDGKVAVCREIQKYYHNCFPDASKTFKTGGQNSKTALETGK